MRGAAWAAPWALAGFGLLLLASSVLAAALAYDPQAALARLAAIAAGLALCFAAVWAARLPSRRLLQTRLPVLVGAAAAIAALGASLTVLVQRPANAGPQAGALVALLPLALLPLLDRDRRGVGSLAAVSLAAAALLCGGAALLLSGERSAWLALALGVALALPAMAGGRLGAPTRAALAITALVVAVAGLLLWWAAGAPLPAFLTERVVLWQRALPLLADYRFTGSGLASTELVYASYALLTHVPYVAHVHNLYMQVALEMGVPALVGLLGLYGIALAATWQTLRAGSPALGHNAAAVLVALLATLLLGLVDSEIVASPWVFALFAPPAAALLVQATAGAEAQRGGALAYPPPRAHAGAARPATWLLPAALGVASLLVVWAFALLPRVQAAWSANRGALLQERAELTNYAQAPWAFQDAIRRDRRALLRPAEDAYQSALLRDPASETALRRLGQIALSLGDVPGAAAYLQEAFRLAPQNSATALLLGEVRALQGDPEAAARLWAPLTLAHRELETRYNWVSVTGSADDLARMERAIVRMQTLQQAAPNEVNP